MRRVAAPALLVLALALAATACGSASTTSTARRAAVEPCAGTAAAHWKHVVWIFLENRSEDETGDIGYMRRTVASRCASFSQMSAEQHASLGNYVAATTGSPAGIRGGCPPAACPITRDSIFDQVARSGRQWRSYAESLPMNCVRRDGGGYLVRHDPAAYLTRIHGDCTRWDVPLAQLASDLERDSLPTFAMVVPDACSSGHDCGDAVVDRWLRTHVRALTSSAAWEDGDVALFVTYDEGDRADAPGVAVNDPCPTTGSIRADCHIATWVIAPGVPAGTTITGRFDHVAMLQLTQRMLGLAPRLGPPRPQVGAVGRELGLLR